MCGARCCCAALLEMSGTSRKPPPDISPLNACCIGWLVTTNKIFCGSAIGLQRLTILVTVSEAFLNGSAPV